MLKASMLKCNGRLLMVLSIYQPTKLTNKKFTQEHHKNIRTVLRKHVMINRPYLTKERKESGRVFKVNLLRKKEKGGKANQMKRHETCMLRSKEKINQDKGYVYRNQCQSGLDRYLNALKILQGCLQRDKQIKATQN